MARCLSDVACGLGFVSYLIRRSRIPARSEQVCVAKLAERSIWSVVASLKKDREDPTSPTSEKQRLLAKGYVGQSAIPPERTWIRGGERSTLFAFDFDRLPPLFVP